MWYWSKWFWALFFEPDIAAENGIRFLNFYLLKMISHAEKVQGKGREVLYYKSRESMQNW